LALAVKSAGRISDAVGRTGAEEFTVFAPGTDRPAALRLVARISDSVARIMPVQLRAGISAAAAVPPRHPPISPDELLQRARQALT
jgi:GGDEF domain-containing protein